MTATREHLHRDDHPGALTVLQALFAGRVHQAASIGFETTEHGAWVDWTSLEHSWLSSTERAAVVAARAIAMAERQGGWPPHLARAITEAIGAPDQRRTKATPRLGYREALDDARKVPTRQLDEIDRDLRARWHDLDATGLWRLAAARVVLAQRGHNVNDRLPHGVLGRLVDPRTYTDVHDEDTTP